MASGDVKGAAERVAVMEEKLDRCAAAVEALNGVLRTMEESLDDTKALFRYYGGEEWYADRALDERGALPETLKRGVLSEDSVYDAVTAVRDTALRMLKLSYDILKDGL